VQTDLLKARVCLEHETGHVDDAFGKTLEHGPIVCHAVGGHAWNLALVDGKGAVAGDLGHHQVTLGEKRPHDRLHLARREARLIYDAREPCVVDKPTVAGDGVADAHSQELGLVVAQLREAASACHGDAIAARGGLGDRRKSCGREGLLARKQRAVHVEGDELVPSAFHALPNRTAGGPRWAMGKVPDPIARYL